MKYIFILLFVLACTSCSNVTNQDKAVASKEYTTPEDLIKYWFSIEIQMMPLSMRVILEKIIAQR